MKCSIWRLASPFSRRCWNEAAVEERVHSKTRRREEDEKLPATYDLEFDGLAIEFYGSYFEVHTNSANVTFCVRVVLQRRTDTAVKTWTQWLWGDLQNTPRHPEVLFLFWRWNTWRQHETHTDLFCWFIKVPACKIWLHLCFCFFLIGKGWTFSQYLYFNSVYLQYNNRTVLLHFKWFCVNINTHTNK